MGAWTLLPPSHVLYPSLPELSVWQSFVAGLVFVLSAARCSLQTQLLLIYAQPGCTQTCASTSNESEAAKRPMAYPHKNHRLAPRLQL